MPLKGGVSCESFDRAIIEDEEMQQQQLLNAAQDSPTLHDKIDPAKYKTKICRNYANGVPCPFEGRCVFAHGDSQLQRTDSSVTSPVVAESRPAPPYNVAIQDACAPPPYSPPPYGAVAPHFSSPRYLSSPAGSFHSGYHAHHPQQQQQHLSSPHMRMSSSMQSLGASSSSENSNNTTPRGVNAYPKVYRHEPYGDSGFTYVEVTTTA